jgi:two-component system invasion response regulator UvrY
MKILIVDDHDVIHHGLNRILSDAFENAVFGDAHNFQEADALIVRERWNVVILDIDLPGRGGFETLKHIKTLHPELPVLMFSLHGEEVFAVRALRSGASGYVPKHGEMSQLVEAIRKVTRGGRYVSATLAEILANDLGQGTLTVPHDILSDREMEVMRMIVSGETTGSIADVLALSVKTVSTYRTRILDKLHLKTTVDLLRYAVDHGLDR